MIYETEVLGRRALQHSHLIEAGLFHAHFLKETDSEELDALLGLKVQKAQQSHTDIIEEAPFSGIADGLYTFKSNEPLEIRHADCQAAIFWDPKGKQLAVVHAGWRGLVQQIYTRTLDAFKRNGAKAEDILVGISPSLGPCHGEFKGWEDYFPPHFKAFEVKENHFDLREAARSELVSGGILPHHLSISTVCTAADPDRFHSWRFNKTDKRLVTVAYSL